MFQHGLTWDMSAGVGDNVCLCTADLWVWHWRRVPHDVCDSNRGFRRRSPVWPTASWPQRHAGIHNAGWVVLKLAIVHIRPCQCMCLPQRPSWPLVSSLRFPRPHLSFVFVFTRTQFAANMLRAFIFQWYVKVSQTQCQFSMLCRGHSCCYDLVPATLSRMPTFKPLNCRLTTLAQQIDFQYNTPSVCLPVWHHPQALLCTLTDVCTVC